MRQLLGSVELIIECRDYRVPLSSRNPMFEETLQGKERLIVYTKRDLAAEELDLKVREASISPLPSDYYLSLRHFFPFCFSFFFHYISHPREVGAITQVSGYFYGSIAFHNDSDWTSALVACNTSAKPRFQSLGQGAFYHSKTKRGSVRKADFRH